MLFNYDSNITVNLIHSFWTQEKSLKPCVASVKHDLEVLQAIAGDDICPFVFLAFVTNFFEVAFELNE